MTAQRLPRLGFAGVGWIGQARLRALVESRAGEVVAIADPSPELRAKARELAPDAAERATFEELLGLPLDAVVIATPSAMHARQAQAALSRGLSVFCQKPLGRDAAETRAVVEAAKRADRLLGLDMSYRATTGMRAIQQLVQSGELGDVYQARLVFHNAYGPDKPWYYDVRQAGGGCLMDLGVHLADLALWVLGFPQIDRVHSALYAAGRRLPAQPRESEDFATALIDTASGASIELACSWNLPAGQDAVIGAEFYGTRGGAAFRNVAGSFYDFRAEWLLRQQRKSLAEPPDAWGGRALIDFAEALRTDFHFRSSTHELSRVAELLERIYQGS
jgi:predicted dehydrogenase